MGQVDDGIFVHGYHSSIWSNGLAGGKLSACGS
ncbi:tniB domain protein, partial [Salmonella enterica]|nr:tniB domain protein [Salmonella enterica]ECC1255816.1 tniB domain protein [Salmonella enterica]